MSTKTLNIFFTLTGCAFSLALAAQDVLMNLLRLTQGLKQNLVFWESAKILTVFNRYFLAPIVGDKFSKLDVSLIVFTRPHDRQLLIRNMMREKYCWHEQDSAERGSILFIDLLKFFGWLKS